MNITEGKKTRPQRVVIYGAEGIGKTTLASQFPDPLFIDLEDGSAQLDVKRVEGIADWAQLGEALKEIITAARDGKPYSKTLIIDTIDKAEIMATAAICKDKGVRGIEDIGYGKGYTYLFEKVVAFLSTLDILIKCGVNVVLLAHAAMRKFEQPDELGAYDRWELKLSKKVAPAVKEWADMLLFCNYKTSVSVTSDGKAKASGGKRVVYASHHPCWDAKNRHGLPDMFDMDYNNIKHIFEEV